MRECLVLGQQVPNAVTGINGLDRPALFQGSIFKPLPTPPTPPGGGSTKPKGTRRREEAPSLGARRCQNCVIVEGSLWPTDNSGIANMEWRL